MYRKQTFTWLYLNFNSHHLCNVKRGIIRCLQHRKKAISIDSEVYQKEIKSLRDKLHRNSYPESIKSAPRNLDWIRDNDTWKLITVCLPYVKGLAEKIERYAVHMISEQYSGVPRLFKNISTKWSRTAVAVETCHPLKVKLEEYRKEVCRGKIEKSGLTDHIWKEKGNPQSSWD